MIVKEYCDNMEKLLAAWRNNITALLKISEAVPGRDADADARQVENLKGLIEDLGRVQKLLKNECLPA